MHEPYIIWCGSVLNYKGLTQFSGETPAATQWSRGLLLGLQENGIGVRGFAPMWDTLFPRGRLLPGDVSGLDETIPQTPVPYINLPWLRPLSVAFSLHRLINRHLATGAKPLAILNYNPYPHYCKAIEPIAARHQDIPWVNVVLDLDDPTKDGWVSFKEATHFAKGNIFLSWWGYCHAPGDSKLHLDGGWSGSLPGLGWSDRPKTFLYAGKFASYGGILEIIEAIREFPRQDVRFDFYGKGSNAALERLASEDKRVRILGFVPDEVLEESCKEAFAFLNPRDMDFHGTRMIFPSKLLFYLKFRKPILSPLLPGLSPDYASLLIQPAGAAPKDWAGAMEKALSLSQVDTDALAAKSEQFLAQKTWKRQAARLVEFLRSLHY